MKKVIALLILVITMVAVYAAAAELPLSTSWKVGNQYYEANRGWGLCRTNDTTFFESNINVGYLHKMVFSDNTTYVITTATNWGTGTTLGSGNTNGIRGLTVTPDGWVVVADNVNNRLYSYDQDLTPKTMMPLVPSPTTNARVYGVSCDNQGRIFINYYIFQYSQLTAINKKRVEVYAHPSTWNGTQLTPLQSFDVDTVNGTGYIWEGSVVKKDASSVYIAARGVNKIYKYSGSVASGYDVDPVFTTIDIIDDPSSSKAYGFRNISLTPDESRIVATYNSSFAVQTADTTAIYFFDAVYGDMLPTSSILTVGGNFRSPAMSQVLANDTECMITNAYDGAIVRLRRDLTLVPNTFTAGNEIWANETSIQFATVGGDSSVSYSVTAVTGAGSISSTGLFIPITRGRVIVVAQDTVGNLDCTNSIVIKGLAIAPTTEVQVGVGQQVALEEIGDGVAPLTWGVSSSALGTISNVTGKQATLTVGPATGTLTVTCTDANGHQTTKDITVLATEAPLARQSVYELFE
jgi:hypothetical protein